MRRRRITRKPTKGESIFGGIVCFAMGCFGLFALPSGFDPVFAGFKAIWCLLAFGMGGYNFLIAAGKVKMGGYEITDDEPDDRRAAPRSDAEARLTELQPLRPRPHHRGGVRGQAPRHSKRPVRRRAEWIF